MKSQLLRNEVSIELERFPLKCDECRGYCTERKEYCGGPVDESP